MSNEIILESAHVKGVSRVALDFIFNTSQDELDYYLTVGLPAGLFSALVSKLSYSHYADFDEDSASESNILPIIHISEKLSESEAAVYATEGLWSVAQELYYSQDRSDLSAWVDEGFPFALNSVDSNELEALLLTDGTALTNTSEKTCAFIQF